MLVCFSVLFLSISPIDVYADDSTSTSYPVALTSAQTLALYGQTIPALWFNGTSTSTVNFEFYKSSLQVVSSFNDSFSLWGGFPWISGYNIQNPIGFQYNSNGSLVPYINAYARSTNLNDLTAWLGEEGTLSKSEICGYEFLIYRWQGDPNTIPEQTNDFEFNFNLSVNISGIDRLRTAFGVSLGQWTGTSDVSNFTMDNYIDAVRIYSAASPVNEFYVTTPLYSVYQTYSRRQSKIPFAVTNPFYYVQNGEVWQVNPDYSNPRSYYDSAFFPCPNVSLCCIDTDGYGTFDWSSCTYQVRAAKSVVCKEDGYYFSDSSNPNYNVFTAPYVYLFVMCPVVWGDVSLPEPEPPTINEQLDGIGTGINDINVNLDQTNTKLDQILQKLDLIYQKEIAPTLDVDLTQQGPLSWIGTKIDNATSSIVSGIRGLFVPTQTDLINFRLNMQADFQNHFPAFFTADDKVRNLYSIFSNSVNPRTTFTVPLVEMSIPDYANNTSADFTFGGFDVELKPKQDQLGILYDSLAIIIDFVATLGLLNMLKKKLHKFLEGGVTD